jgi:Ser/Thr protein kinase RdoA (MazF antagonist)
MVTDDQIAAALATLTLQPTGPALPVVNSILNDNFRVETESGAVFLRAHRASRPRERIERMHLGAAWAMARGLPTPVPRAAPSGAEIVESGGRLWSAYEWIDGETFQRGAITSAQAALLGSAHGRCLSVLQQCPSTGLPPNSELTWSTDQTRAALTALEQHVAERGTAQEQRWFATQRSIMESAAARPSTAFPPIQVQASHGDFHERNVMFDGAGSLAGVVDWERFCVQHPVFEVLLAVSFMLILEEEPLGAYLESLRSEFALAPGTIRPCIETWWQSSLHNTWVFREVFLDGNEAARQFLPEEEGRSRSFNNPEFREWLAAMVRRYGCRELQ